MHNRHHCRDDGPPIVLDCFIVLACYAIPHIHTNAVLLYTCYNDILLQLINIHH